MGDRAAPHDAGAGGGADPAVLSTLGLDADRVPRHVAIIMDGNGRWAQARGLPRIWGHREGAVRVREIVTRAGDLGIEHLTLFSFSSENWKRPSEEIRQLMLLCVAYLDGEERRLADEGVRLRVIGRRAGLPTDVVEAIERVERTTAGGTRGQLNLAINYGGRAEIADAARAIAARVASGQLDPDAIDEATVADNLYTAGMPDPDLLIRTAGEMRVSNYLLWQISYAEIHVCEAPWPEFDADRFDAAIRDYAGRTRRYGLTDAQLSAADGDAGR